MPSDANAETFPAAGLPAASGGPRAAVSVLPSARVPGPTIIHKGELIARRPAEWEPPIVPSPA